MIYSQSVFYKKILMPRDEFLAKNNLTMLCTVEDNIKWLICEYKIREDEQVTVSWMRISEI